MTLRAALQELVALVLDGGHKRGCAARQTDCNCGYEHDIYLAAKAARAALAGAPLMGEPVAQTRQACSYCCPSCGQQEGAQHKAINECQLTGMVLPSIGFNSIPVSSAPSKTPAENPGEALDAARYRWLRDTEHLAHFVDGEYSRASTRARKVDAAIDTAMRAAKGDGK